MRKTGIKPTVGIDVHFEDTSFRIEATYWADVEIDYAEIDTLAYRENFETGARIHGFGSPRLSMGTFQNDEFGPYTLYAYTGAEEYIVMEIGLEWHLPFVPPINPAAAPAGGENARRGLRFTTVPRPRAR